MKKLSKKEVEELLAQPNGSSLADIDAAWDGVCELVLVNGDSAALSVWVRAAKQKRYREKIERLLPTQRMAELLTDPAPKTRKNAARLAGALSRPADRPALIRAFEQEDVRMVRPSQILALGALGATEVLQSYTVPEAADASEEKHARAEQEALDKALARVATVPVHRVRGLPRGLEAELTVADGMEITLIRELKAAGLSGKKVARGRVALTLSSYKALLQVRSWRELLFPILTFETRKDMWASPEKLARIIGDRISDRLRELLTKVYEGDGPYPYRIEMKAQSFGTLLNRSKMSRAIAKVLDGPVLINAPSHYETELRIERHGWKCTVYVKFCTLPDPRFAYRRGTVSASIHPATAAAVMQFVAPYFSPNAQVLDPCCGSGTMLIERARYDACQSLFGVDLSSQAIRIAEDNMAAAGLDAKLIVKDCTEFTAKSRFDEVIANLPFGIRVGDHEGNVALYDAIFRNLPQWLKPGGIAVLYTMEIHLIHRMLRKYTQTLELKNQLRTEAGGLDPGVFIIQVRR